MELLLAVVAGVLVCHRPVPDAAAPAGAADHRSRPALERVEHPDSLGCGRDARQAAAHLRSAHDGRAVRGSGSAVLILTAIVIGFGVLAFALVLAHRVHQSAGSDDIDTFGSDPTQALSDKPDRA